MMRSNERVDDYPTYEELPSVEGSDLRHAWSVFGDDDSFGTLNHLTPARRLAGLAAVRSGRTIGLTLPLDQPDPAPYGRAGLGHEIYPANGFSWGDRIAHLDTQASTQWDGLLHVSHREVGFYGGHRGAPGDALHLGIDAWARTGILGRGVLLDVARFLGEIEEYDPLGRRAVTPRELEAVAAAQGVEVAPGDVLCLRFGWHGGFGELHDDDRVGLMSRPQNAGLSAGADTAAWLWDRRIAAVACDNATVEVQPGDPADGFLHHRLITMLGMPLGELFDFEALADACAASQRWDFLFVSVPLHLTGGVGSPANAVAVV